jgi:two-component system, OmpR family, sensor histidine kinase CiaH
MPDGASATGVNDPAETEALATDGRLVRRVRWRLVAWSGLSTLAVLIVLGASLYLMAARTLEAQGIKHLDDRIAEIRGVRPDLDDPGLGFIFGGPGSGTFAMILDEAGRPINTGPGHRAQTIPDGLPIDAGLEAAAASSRDIRLVTVKSTPLRVLTEQAETDIGPVYLQVIEDRTTEESTLNAILTVLLVGGAVVILVALGFGALYANRALVPIRESLATQRLALRRQREFAADASHELRTPLTVVRSSLEHLRRHADEPVNSVGDALDDIGAEVEHLTSLVDDLLLLARSDSGAISLDRQPLDLGDVAAAAASSLAKPAGAKAVSVEVDPEPAMVEGDAARLRQLVFILVDNAIRHSPTGGHVRVAVRRDGANAFLDVEDDGKGVKPEDMSHVFERFWRATGAPSGGTGLGLAIAKWIVDRHHGQIEVSNRQGGGAHFRVRLPSSDVATA